MPFIQEIRKGRHYVVAVAIIVIYALVGFVPQALAQTFDNYRGTGYLLYPYKGGSPTSSGEWRHTSGDGNVAYCIDYGKNNPTSNFKNGFTLKSATKKVLQAGYPNEPGAAYGITDTKLRYCTQMAIWVAEGDMDASLLTSDGSDTAGDKELIALIKKLAAGSYSPAKVKVTSPTSSTPVQYGSYWRWGPYKVTGSLWYSTYSVSITSGPTGAFVGNASGGGISSVALDDSFYIYINPAATPAAVSFTVTASERETDLLTWAPPSADPDMQRMVECVPRRVRVATSPSVDYYTIAVSKTAEDNRLGDREFRIEKIAGGGSAYDRTFKTDSNGRILTPPLEAGTYRITEINVPERYRTPPAQTVTIGPSVAHHVNVKFENELIKSDFEVVKHDLDDPSTYVADTEYKVYVKGGSALAPTWDLYATRSTDASGTVLIKDVPYGDYYVVESKPAYQYLNEEKNREPRYWSVRVDGDEIREDYYNEHEKISCRVNLSTIRRTQEQDVYRYDITNIANTSNTVGDTFHMTDVIDTSMVRLKDLYTGVYEGDDDNEMEVLYKTNLEDWRVWEDGVPTTRQTHLFVADLDLAEDEYVEAFRYSFGSVEEMFSYAAPSSYFVTVLPEVTQGDLEQTIVGNVGVQIERSDMTALDSDNVETRLVDTFGLAFANTAPSGFGEATVKKTVGNAGPRMADLDLIPYILVVLGSLAIGGACAAKTLEEKRGITMTNLFARGRVRVGSAIRRALNNDAGQGTTEYAIIVGVLVVIAILAVTAFKGKIQDLWDQISTGIMGL